MSHKEILTKAIEKAIGGGWVPFDNEYQQKQKPDSILTWLYDGSSYSDNKLDYLIFIFNHDFAKALWGEGQMGKLPKHGLRVGASGWQMHLQQLVIAEEPIAYLGQNI